MSDFRAKQAATRVLRCCCFPRGWPGAVSGSSSMPGIPPSSRQMAGCIFHRATDGFGLAVPLKPTQLLPLPWTRPLHLPPAPSSLALSTPRVGTPPASLGSLGRGLAALRGKNLFLVPHLKPPSLGLTATPCPIIFLPNKKPSSTFPAAPSGLGRLLSGHPQAPAL